MQKSSRRKAEQMDLTEILQEKIAHLSARQGPCMRAFVHGGGGVGASLFFLPILSLRGTVRG